MAVFAETNRQNALLSNIYQSKLFSLFGLGGYSRQINQFVDGFITQTGVVIVSYSISVVP